MPNVYNPMSGSFDYQGVNYVVRKRSPTIADYIGLFVPTMWVNSDSNDAYLLTDNTVGHIQWLQLGNGLSFQEQAVAIAVATIAPPTEVTGDRYVIDNTVGVINAGWGAGAAKNDVAEYDGTTWIYTTASEGMMIYNEADNHFYVFDGTDWQIFSNIVATMTTIEKGVGELCTDAEVVAGALTDYHVVNPSSLKAKLGAQTQYAVAIGAGTATAIAWQALTDGQILIGSTGNTPTATTLSGGTGSSITSAAGSITVNVIGGGVQWITATADTNLVVNTGYITKHATPATLLTYTLPATAAVGTVTRIVGNTVGGWKVAQNASQQIIVGANASTAGVGGYIASSDSQYNTCTLLCVTADTTWQYIDGFGTIAIV